MLPSPTGPPGPPSEKKERAGDTLGGKSQRSKDAPDHPAAFQVCPAVLGCTCALGLQRRGGLAIPGPLPPASLSPRAARVRPTPRSPSATQPPKRFPEGRKTQQKLPGLSLCIRSTCLCQSHLFPTALCVCLTCPSPSALLIIGKPASLISSLPL